MKIFYASALLGMFSYFFVGWSAGTQNIVINEIAWMGTAISPNDEWIELYNPTSSPIALTGWRIEAQDGTPSILLDGTIPASGYFLLERTDDTSAPEIAADIIYAGALENGADALTISDASGNTVDIVSSWSAGDNNSKETMALVNSIWANGPAGGTPKAANTTAPFTESELESTPATETSPQSELIPESSNQTYTEENEQVVQYPQFIHTEDVVINELLPNPAGNDATDEWIELRNFGDMSYDISNWILDNYTIPLGTVIAPNGYLLFERADTGIALTNTGDAFELKYPDGSVAHRAAYSEKAAEGISYGLFNDGWYWSQVPTPGEENIKIQSETEQDAVTLVKAEVVNSTGQSAQNQAEETPQSHTNTAQEFSAQITAKNSSLSTIAVFALVTVVALSIGAGTVFAKQKFLDKQKSTE